MPLSDKNPQDTSRAFMPYPPAPVSHAASGPLSGLSFSVKDLFDVVGYPTSGGQPLWLALSGIKQRSAPTVQRLLDAGARFAGKTVTDELAFSMTGRNAHFGSPVNGAAPDRIAGGSSSGSASAVSHGLCDFALGTDTGGSVRAPANHCGLIGLRPTHARVSLQGAVDLAPSFDTCGWFARDIGTFARVADVLLGDDAAPLPAKPRLLAPTDVWALLSAPVLGALAAPRARVEAALGSAKPVAVVLDSFDTMYWSFRYLQGREAWQSDGAFIERHQPVLGSAVAQRFAWARGVTDAQVAEANAFRTRFRAHLNALLGSDGVLVLPTMPDVAPLASADEEGIESYRNQATYMLCIAGLAGLPQLSLPLATRLGAPLGLSLLGPAGSDRSLVRLAERIGS
ncbi:MAG: amidase [Burkholderiaceae bacterium]